MTAGYTLLLGGVRSGKSSLAQRIAADQHRPVCVVATAEPIDDDMAARIARHRDDRPTSWSTIEEPLLLADAVGRVSDSYVVVDCLTVWLGNALHHGWTDDEIMGEIDAFIDVLVGRAAASVVVSNEVGLGVHPETPLGRHYRDLLGHVNSRVARSAAASHLLVAGRVLSLADPAPILGLNDAD